jgi:hypothetical protein
MDTILPYLAKLGEYGVAVFAIGAMSALLLVVFLAQVRAWERQEKANRETWASQLSAMTAAIHRVGERMDRLADAPRDVGGGGDGGGWETAPPRPFPPIPRTAP